MSSGRFQGVQFDLDGVEYGEEVILTVRARVHEVTVRTTASGEARQISVLKPLDVVVEGDALAVVVPDLGEPLHKDSFEVKSFGDAFSDVGDGSEERIVFSTVERSSAGPKNPLLVSKDKMLAKFLEE